MLRPLTFGLSHLSSAFSTSLSLCVAKEEALPIPPAPCWVNNFYIVFGIREMLGYPRLSLLHVP